MNSTGMPRPTAPVLLTGTALFLLPFSNLLAAPAGPAPQVPEGGGAPGAYPNTSVSAVNVLARGSTTFTSSVEITGLEGNGPIPWSVNRYNRGDFSLRLSPRNPAAALGNLNQGAIDFSDAGAGVAASQAWRPSWNRGVVIPTARQNGPIDWNDGEGGFTPTVGVAWASSGPGYNMMDGTWGNGDLDINTGRAGNHGSSPEGNFSFSVSWFPFDQGWLGGDVNNPGTGDPAGVLPDGYGVWSTPDSHAPGLTAGMIRWVEYPVGSGSYGGLAQIRLPGVNANSDGMIFTASSDGNSDVNITNVLPFTNGEGWSVAVREDSAADSVTLAGGTNQSEFQFLYVPYNAVRLIGGRVTGAGAKAVTRGDFTVSRTAAGTYSISIPGKNASSGTLLLQAAGGDPVETEVPSRAILSYQYTAGSFVVKAVQVTGDTTVEAVDTDFYFTWVDFAEPLAMPDAPRLRAQSPVALHPAGSGISTKGANLAVNPGAEEVLVTTIDTTNLDIVIDPITGSPAVNVLVGCFYNPSTLAPLGAPFPILTNGAGEILKHDVKFNPVANRYVVAAKTTARGTGGSNVVTLALVKPSVVAGVDPPAETPVIHDPDSAFNYDDVSLAVSTANGNILLAAERAFTGEGEGVVGVLFDKDLTAITTGIRRLDNLQAVGDEDDPDVIYLPSRDAFLYIANTDNSNGSTGTLSSRVVVSVVQTAPGAGGALVSTNERPIGDATPAAEGHPSAIENPFNNQLLSVWDNGDGTSAGDLAYTTIAAGPAYTTAAARAEVPFLRGGPAGNPYTIRHPQLAADPDSGVIVLGVNAAGSIIGLPDAYTYRLLGPDGLPFAGQTHADFLADIPGGIDNGPNMHNIKYSPASRSFLAVYNTLPDINGIGVTYLASLAVTSNHLPAAAAPPTIEIAASGANVIVSWPASATAYLLHASDNLTSGWAAVGIAPVRDGGFDRVTVPRDRMRRFFRLTTP